MSILNDSQWNKIKDILPGKQSDPGRTGADNRQFVEAIMWVGRNGARWRALPPHYGNWNSVHRRFRRWSKKGIWQMIFNTLAVSADTEWLDSVVKLLYSTSRRIGYGLQRGKMRYFWRNALRCLASA